MTLTRWVHLGICCLLTKHKTLPIVSCQPNHYRSKEGDKISRGSKLLPIAAVCERKMASKVDGAVNINAAWKNWGNWKVSIEFRFDFLFIYLNSLGESFQLQPTVPARRSQVRKWEPGILWSLHRGRTAAVRGQSMCSSHRYCSYVCAQRHFKEVTWSPQGFEHRRRGPYSAKYLQVTSASGLWQAYYSSHFSIYHYFV